MITKWIPVTQVTPLIQFQRNEKYAGLRASEVKPALDNFLFQYFAKDKHWNYREKFVLENENHFDILVDKGAALAGYSSMNESKKFQALKHLAFDYKLRIIANKEIELKDVDEKTIPVYFADLGKSEKHIESFCAEYFFQVSSYSIELIEKIFDLLPRFLAENNFGMRKAKGLGSFQVHQKEPCIPDNYITFFKASNDVKLIFKSINLLSRAIRGGINEKGSYMKPLIFKYYKDKGFQWEKKTIKEEFYSRELADDKTKHSLDAYSDQDSPLFYESNKKLLIRDVLGLSSKQAWNERYNNDTISKENFDKANTELYTQGGIKRISSCLYFKPLRKDETIIYIIEKTHLSQLNEDEKWFRISKTIDSHLGVIDLKLPKSFELKQLFNYLENEEFSLEELTNGLKGDYKKIIDILNECKKNLKK